MSPRRCLLLALLSGLGCSMEQSVVGGAILDATVAPDGVADRGTERDVVDVPPAECRADIDCGDGVACTVDVCRAGRCQHAPSSALCPAGSACEILHGCRIARACDDDRGCRDDDPCTLAERCDVARRVCVFDELPEETPCGAQGSGLACRGGACQCPTGRSLLCGDRCVDVRGDSEHCGGCANVCAAGSWCRDGVCACPAPQVYCPGLGCVDTSQDLANCGACGRSCRGGDAGTERCIEGMCLAPCGVGTHRCGTTCAADTSPATCGTSCAPCPMSSHGSAACVAGRCALDCAAGYHACGGSCVELTSLGGCGPACAVCVRPVHGSVACVADACRVMCAAGYHACRGDCVSDASALTCGASCEPCPVPAHGSATCVGGACGVTCDAGFRACGGVCSDGTTPLACGSSCAPCPVPTHGSATCVGGACGFTCDLGFHRCGAECLSDGSPLSCGSSCAPCPVPTNGSATCAGGACGLSCDLGFRREGSACIELPRLLAPGSLVTVTVRRPTLRWRHPAGLTGASVDLCRDRACESVIETLMVSGSSASPTRDLPRGPVFWRVRGSGDAGSSATWEFVVGAVSAPVEATWGSLTDLNGDGYGDVVTAAPDGRASLFLGAPGGLRTPPAAMVAPPSGAGGFGQAIAAGDVNGDGYGDLVVSAPSADGGRGRVLVYAGGAGVLGARLLAALASPAPVGSRFGVSVAVVGDVDGDGYGDLVVGAPGAGRAYLFRGGAMGPEAVPGAELAGPGGAGSRFGVAVAGAGDVDADGLADVIVGADGVASDQGRAYLLRGARASLGTAPWVELRSSAGGNFGQAVAGVGDVDGDGYPDVAVGSPLTEFVGRVFVFAGGASGVGTTPVQTLRSPMDMPTTFGAAVASAGDFDGDGYSDLVVGAPGLLPSGGVQLFLGSATGVAVTPAATWTGIVGAGSGFGLSLSSGRDVDGDGLSDVVLGAEYANTFDGALMIVQGGSLTGVPHLIPTPPAASGYFGHAIASGGAPPRRPTIAGTCRSAS